MYKKINPWIKIKFMSWDNKIIDGEIIGEHVIKGEPVYFVKTILKSTDKSMVDGFQVDSLPKEYIKNNLVEGNI
jgi:hypothetical protein